MTIATLLAMLIQTGICAKQEFVGPDDRPLTVIVCPFIGPPPPANDDKPKTPA